MHIHCMSIHSLVCPRISLSVCPSFCPYVYSLGQMFIPPRCCRCHIPTWIIYPDDMDIAHYSFWFIQGAVVEKFDKFHHHWQMYLLNFTVSPYFCVYVHEIHFLIASDDFILTRAKKMHYIRTFLWEGRILATKGESKTQLPWGYLWLFEGRCGAPMAVSERYGPSRLRWGRKEKKNCSM